MTQNRLARPSLGGLLATRRGALTLALLCAVSAAGLLVFALGRYRSNLRTVTPQSTVLVAIGNIPKGTSGDAITTRGLFKAMPIIATQLAPGAVSNSADLAGKVVATTILPGQQLTLSDFTGVSGVTGLLAPNQRAVAVSIDEAHGDTDILQAGDRVDVYAQFPHDAKGPQIVLLLPNVLVIKPASTTPAIAGGKAITGGSLILAVTAQQAPELQYAAANGALYLSLRPANASQSPNQVTTLSSILSTNHGLG